MDIQEVHDKPIEDPAFNTFVRQCNVSGRMLRILSGIRHTWRAGGTRGPIADEVEAILNYVENGVDLPEDPLTMSTEEIEPDEKSKDQAADKAFREFLKK